MRPIIRDFDDRVCYGVEMLTRRATVLGLAGMAAYSAVAFAGISRSAPSISRRKASAEFERVFRLIIEGDFNAILAYGRIQLVVEQRSLTEEESRAFVAEIAAEAKASGPKFFRLNSFERAKSDLNHLLFYATLQYRSRVENYCYPQYGDGGMPLECTNEPGYEMSIVGWYAQFEGTVIKRLQQTHRIS